MKKVNKPFFLCDCKKCSDQPLQIVFHSFTSPDPHFLFNLSDNRVPILYFL